jgi:O-antigen/teichoic acid export membrane protein
MMARQAHEDRTALRRNYIFGFKSLFMVALPVAIVTTFLAPTLIGILGGDAYLPDGGIALQIMIWSILVGWINSLTQYVLIALDRQRLITGAFVLAVSFNIITNLIFLPQFSYRAAAITTIFSEMVLLVAFYRLLRRDLENVNYFSILWRPVVAGGAMLAVLLGLWQVMPILALVGCGVVYVITLLILNPLTPEESTRLSRILPTRLQRFVLRS